jgi:hypothetical protein
MDWSASRKLPLSTSALISAAVGVGSVAEESTEVGYLYPPETGAGCGVWAAPVGVCAIVIAKVIPSATDFFTAELLSET